MFSSLLPLDISLLRASDCLNSCCRCRCTGFCMGANDRFELLVVCRVAQSLHTVVAASLMFTSRRAPFRSAALARWNRMLLPTVRPVRVRMNLEKNKRLGFNKFAKQLCCYRVVFTLFQCDRGFLRGMSHQQTKSFCKLDPGHEVGVVKSMRPIQWVHQFESIGNEKRMVLLLNFVGFRI